MTKINISPQEVDRLGDLRAQKSGIEKEIATLTGIMVKSGWPTLLGTRYRAVVVERELEIVYSAALRERAGSDSLFRIIVRKFLGVRTQTEVRTWFVDADDD